MLYFPSRARISSAAVSRVSFRWIKSPRSKVSVDVGFLVLIGFPLWWSPRGQGRNPVGHEVASVLAIALGLLSVRCAQDFHPVDADVVTFEILRQVKKVKVFHGSS